MGLCARPLALALRKDISHHGLRHRPPRQPEVQGGPRLVYEDVLIVVTLEPKVAALEVATLEVAPLEVAPLGTGYGTGRR